jgi:DNA-binding response OmpR family regulator
MATVLLASRDPAILLTRRLVVESAGHRTLQATDLGLALNTAKEQRPALVVIGHTFPPGEQDEFAKTLHATHPEICVLLLRDMFVDPVRLLQECEASLRCEPGVAIVREMRD